MADDESTNDASSTDDDAILPDETVEATETDSKESEDKTEDTEADETEEPEAEEEESHESESEAETTEESEESEPDPKEVARQDFLKRQADRQAREAQRQQQYDQYESEAETEEQQAIRRLETRLYDQTVKSTESSLVNDFEKATSKIDIFNPSKPDKYKPLALNDAITEYNNGYIHYDENGNMVGVKQPFFEYLQSKAVNVYGELLQSGARTGQRAESKMRARAETPSSATTKEPKGDKFLEGFDKEEY